MERVIFEHDMSEVELNYMKIIRRNKDKICFKEIKDEPLIKIIP